MTSFDKFYKGSLILATDASFIKTHRCFLIRNTIKVTNLTKARHIPWAEVMDSDRKPVKKRRLEGLAQKLWKAKTTSKSVSSKLNRNSFSSGKSMGIIRLNYVQEKNPEENLGTKSAKASLKKVRTPFGEVKKVSNKSNVASMTSNTIVKSKNAFTDKITNKILTAKSLNNENKQSNKMKNTLKSTDKNRKIEKQITETPDNKKIPKSPNHEGNKNSNEKTSQIIPKPRRKRRKGFCNNSASSSSEGESSEDEYVPPSKIPKTKSITDKTLPESLIQSPKKTASDPVQMLETKSEINQSKSRVPVGRKSYTKRNNGSINEAGIKTKLKPKPNQQLQVDILQEVLNKVYKPQPELTSSCFNNCKVATEKSTSQEKPRSVTTEDLQKALSPQSKYASTEMVTMPPPLSPETDSNSIEITEVDKTDQQSTTKLLCSSPDLQTTSKRKAGNNLKSAVALPEDEKIVPALINDDDRDPTPHVLPLLFLEKHFIRTHKCFLPRNYRKIAQHQWNSPSPASDNNTNKKSKILTYKQNLSQKDRQTRLTRLDECLAQIVNYYYTKNDLSDEGDVSKTSQVTIVPPEILATFQCESDTSFE